MKRNLVAGLFAVGLIVAGGTGYYMAGAKDNSEESRVFMQQQGITGPMTQMMNLTNNKGERPSAKTNENTFEQMLPYMKQAHPNLSDEQLKSLYEEMMGDNGSFGCGGVQGMMGNFNTNTTNSGL